MASYSEYLAQKMRNQLIFLDTRPRWTAGQFTEVARNNANIVLDRRPNGVPGFDATAIPSFFAANAYRSATAAQDKPPQYIPNAPAPPPPPPPPPEPIVGNGWTRRYYRLPSNINGNPTLENPASWGTPEQTLETLPAYQPNRNSDAQGSALIPLSAPLPSIYDFTLIHFTGFFVPPESGSYVFSVYTDDGFQMNINGNRIINTAITEGPILQARSFGRLSSPAVNLVANQWYPIEAMLPNGIGQIRLQMFALVNGVLMNGNIQDCMWSADTVPP